jgi:replicative DNA helicase
MLDKISGGLVRGEIITLAGGPGSGKTSLGLQVVEFASRWGLQNDAVRRENGKKPDEYTNVVISCEMSRFSLYMRSACRLAGLDTTKLRVGNVTKDELELFFAKLDELMALPILILDRPGMRSSDVRNCIQMLMAEGLKIGVCCVDYIQRLADEGDNVNVRVSNIMQNLGIAMSESECCMLLLSQYSRAKEREKRPPQLTDLRDSGSIEQDSYQVWALHDPDPEAKFSGGLMSRDLFILKNRNGRLGHLKLDFHPVITRFDEPPERRAA